MATGAGTLIQVETPPAIDDARLIDRLSELYLTAKQAKNNQQTEWKRNFRVTMNRAAPAAPAAPGTRANEVFPVIDSRIGWMTDQEVIFTVTPACDPYNMYALAQEILAQQLEDVLNSNYKVQGWYAEIVKMLWDAAIYGTGFLKTVWDQGLEWGLGNVAVKSTSPWCLYVDPYATSLDDAEYIIEVHTMTPSEIERRFPSTSKASIAQAEITGDTSTEHQPPQQGSNNQKQGVLIPVGTGPTVPATTWGLPGQAKWHTDQNERGINVYECWFRENYEETITPGDPTLPDQKVIVDQWRVVVYAGDQVFLDELAENLFHMNRHPYSRYCDIEVGEFWAPAILRDLAPCQQALNTLLAMAQNNTVFTGNPIMVGIKGSGLDRSTFFNRPGMIYDVNGSPGGGQNNRPDWLAPPNLPTSLMDLIMLWREEIERIAGLTGTQRGEVPSGRATDKQVSAGQEAGFIRIRSSLRNLELTLRNVGELAANLIIINYDTPRFVAIVGDDAETSSIRLAAQHFYGPTLDQKNKVTFQPLRFALIVNSGSSKPTSRAARIAEANALKQMEVVDDLFVLQAYRVNHAQAIMQRKQLQAQTEADMEAMKAGAKGPKPKSPAKQGG